MATGFRERILVALATVGPGQVISYGDLAFEAGRPGAGRGVGAVMAGSRPEEELPWWRVVYADGRLAPGKEAEQGRRLRAEGVRVVNGRVDGLRSGRQVMVVRSGKISKSSMVNPPATAGCSGGV